MLITSLDILKPMKDRWGPCPACKVDPKRGAVYLGHGGTSWTCTRCEATGDGIDLVSFVLIGCKGRDAGPRFPEVLAWLKDRHHITIEAKDQPEPEPVRPPITTLAGALRACTPAHLHHDASKFLASRGILGPVPAGVLPSDFGTDWWPRPFTDNWPLVVPCFTGDGHLGGMHGRAIYNDLVKAERWTERRACTGDGPHAWVRVPAGKSTKVVCSVCHVEQGRKSTWPRKVSSQGLLFADPTIARPWLQGGTPPERVLIVEGITDFLAACSVNDGLPILGIESGSHKAFRLMRWADDCRVTFATDNDAAGDGYAKRILEHLPPSVVAYRAAIPRVLA